MLLVPIWIASFAQHAEMAASGPLELNAIAVEGSGSRAAYPRIRGVVPGGEQAFADSRLALGDEILRVADADLAGASTLDTSLRMNWLHEPGTPLAITYRRGDAVAETELPHLGVPVPWWWPMCFSASFAAVAFALLLRAPKSRTARATAYAFLAFSFSWLVFRGHNSVQALGGLAVYGISMVFAGPLLLRAVLLLPEETATRRASVHRLPWLFVVMGPVATSAFTGFPLPAALGVRLHPVLMASVYAILLLILARNYRAASAVGRRQIKWVLLGFYVALAPALLVTMVIAAQGHSFIGYTASLLAMPLVPVAFLIAIVRSNLFDIDRLISAAASYSAITVLVLTGLLVAVPRGAEAIAEWTGLGPSVGRFGLSLALVVVAVPLHRRLGPRVDRIFFPERHAIERGVETLQRELPLCATPGALVQQTGRRLAAMSSDTFVLYGRSELAFGPLFVEGRGVPLAIEADGALERALLAEGRAVDARLFSRGPRGREFSPPEHAALESLGDGVLLPVRGAGRLAAFAFMGAKRSGDIYTPGELALLTAVASQLSNELLRFETQELLEQSRSMQLRLRRYVPGAITRQLEAGDELAEGEREVTVLFVDVRGYTAIAQELLPSEIFSTVNRYTETVSTIVQRHGGTIVEFNGDGMMTVFGAPFALAHKEIAAVATARDIALAMRSIGAGGVDAASAGEAIQVGIGIATGPAYVGNVHSVDRLIWTALGNTTNLAARLQSLSRDLDTAIVIDGTTRSRCEAAASDFEERGPTQIRGRSDPVDVSTLSL